MEGKKLWLCFIPLISIGKIRKLTRWSDKILALVYRVPVRWWATYDGAAFGAAGRQRRARHQGSGGEGPQGAEGERPHGRGLTNNTPL